MNPPAGMPLPDSSQTLRALLDAAPNAMVMIDEHGHILFANHATSLMFGFDEAELLGQNVAMLMPQSLRQQHDSFLQRHTRTGINGVIGTGREVTGQHKDGHPIQIHLAVGKSQIGEVNFFIGVMTDISDRIQAEKQLQQDRDLRELVRLAANQFLVADARHDHSQAINEAIQRIAGCQRTLIAELIEHPDGSRSLRSLPFVPESAPMKALSAQSPEGLVEFHNFDNLICLPVLSGQPLLCNTPAHHPAWAGMPPGEWGVENILGIPVMAGDEVIGLFVMANRPGGFDEAQTAQLKPLGESLSALLYARRMRARAEVRDADILRAAERQRLILQNAPMGVAVIDEEGIYESVNPAYCKLYGYRAEEMLGANFTMVFPSDARERVLNLHQNFLRNGGALRGQWQVITRQGELRSIISESIRLEGDNKKAARLVYVMDVSEQVQLEAELRAKNELLQRMAELDGLTQTLNHCRILEQLETERLRAKRHGSSLCVAMIDFDHFKSVNDNFGHLIGDEVLCEAARVIRCGLREIDWIGRYGGEEFLIILPDTPFDAACDTLERLRLQVEAIQFSIPELRVSFSAGLSRWVPEESCSELLTRIDKHLYSAKTAGRACCHCD